MKLEQLVDEESLVQLFLSPNNLLGSKVYFYKEIDSTNLEAQRLIKTDMERKLQGALLIALKQHKGKGTKGTSWFSPKGMSLYTSAILYPLDEFKSKDLCDLTIKIGNEIVVLVKDFCDDSMGVEIKPPNDILIRGKKVIGILCESSTLKDKVNYIIIGLGINLFKPEIPIPKELENKIGFLSDYLKDGAGIIDLYKEIVLGLGKIIK